MLVILFLFLIVSLIVNSLFNLYFLMLLYPKYHIYPLHHVNIKSIYIELRHETMQQTDFFSVVVCLKIVISYTLF